MIVGLFHTGRTVGDLNRSVTFYRDVLGIEHVRTQVSDQPYLSDVTGFPRCSLKIGFVQAEGDIGVLEMIEYVHPKGGHSGAVFGRAGTPHVGWAVDNLSAAYERLLRKGVAFLAAPHTVDDGPWRNARGAFLLDPDGLLVELLEIGGPVGQDGRLTRMHHTGFTVGNLEAALEFLCDNFGLSVMSRYEGESAYVRYAGHLQDGYIRAAYVSLPKTDHVLELWEFRTPSDTPADTATNIIGSCHFCFLVDDILTDYQTLSTQGVPFVGPPVQVTAGANKGGYAIYLNWPDVRLEFFQGPLTKVAA